MAGTSGDVSQLRAVYAPLATVPSVNSAWIDGQHRSVSLFHSQADINRKLSRSFVSTHLRTADGFVTLPGAWELDKSALLSSVSPSGRFVAVVRETDAEQTTKNENNKSFSFIELWEGSRLLKSVPTEGKHGRIYNDEFFRCLAWSSDETLLVYTAEEPSVASKAKERGWFFEAKKKAPATELASTGYLLEQESYRYESDFGEQNTNNRKPRLFVLNVAMATDDSGAFDEYADNAEAMITEVAGIPSELACGQASFVPHSKDLVFVGVPPDPNTLGRIYCSNRTSHIYHVRPGSDAQPISSTTDRTDYAARFVTVSPDGQSIAYFTSTNEFTHGSVESLRVIPWNAAEGQPAGATRTAIEPVALSDGEHSFPGLYVGTVVAKAWLDNEHFVVTSIWRSQTRVLALNVTSGAHATLSGLPRGSATVLAVQPATSGEKSAAVVVTVSTPISSTVTFYGTVDTSRADFAEHVQWLQVHDSQTPRAATLLAGATWSVVTVPSSPDYEYIQVLPANAHNIPILLYPHGGPHSSWVTSFFTSNAFFVALGYGLLLVNYRGSLGFGQAPLEGLCGKCGTQDVQDTVAALDHFIAANPGVADENRLGVTGGSHGGFLTAHLVGQYPERFKTGVLRNPVINISSMVGTTDIPEWCSVESMGVAFDSINDALRLDEKRIAAMFSASPISHVTAIKAACMIIIGKNDRRVPPSQGMELYRALKRQNVPTRVLHYSDPHAIMKVESNADCWLNTALWLRTYLV